MKMTLITLVGLLAAAPAPRAQLPATSPARAGFDPVRLERVHETVHQFIDSGQHSGIVTLVARNGKIAHFHAAGYRDLENKLPMEKDTICRIYSMSKIITSVGLLSLWEDGRFGLDDPIAYYLPELKDAKVMTGGTADAPQLEAGKRPVTIKHLLTHTSGWIYDFDAKDELQQLYKRSKLWDSSSLKEFTEKVAKLPLKHQPGDAFSYGINTDILGALIERLSGKSFEAFLQERVFGPLKMKDTSFDVPADKRSRLAKVYKHGSDGKLAPADDFLGASPEPGVGIPSGGGGLFSTAGDYARFAQMLLNGGKLDGARVLGRKTVELMTANHMVSLPDQAHALNRSQGFGLGVEVQLELGRGALPGSPGAFGWYGAATTYARIDPKEHLVAIALAQHFPFNEHGLFAKFATGYYQALE